MLLYVVFIHLCLSFVGLYEYILVNVLLKSTFKHLRSVQIHIMYFDRFDFALGHDISSNTLVGWI